jgi:hypothetical protein
VDIRENIELSKHRCMVEFRRNTSESQDPPVKEGGWTRPIVKA